MRIKSQLGEFALFGGQPAFKEQLHVGRPNVGDTEAILTRIRQALEGRWLTNNGPFVQEFEHRVADLLGVKHCIAMCNATVALEITIRAIGLSGEVIIPSFTFVATAHALQWQEITPVFCDINPRTHAINPDRIEELITPRTTGIIGVHLWGQACDVERLTDIARRRNLHLMFDAAHAFACSYKGKMIGNFGEAEVFSFHATKFFNTFEGGAVVTNSDDLAAKIRLMNNFGFQGYDNVVYVGTNGKMNEVSAAMGLTGLESLEEFVATNYQNYKQYERELKGMPGVVIFAYNESEKNNYQYIVLEIDEMLTQVCRDDLIKILWAENILARRYFYPGCHRMEPYCSYFPHSGLMLPETEELVRRILILPTGTSVGRDYIKTICHIINMVLSQGANINQLLAEQQSFANEKSKLA